MSEPDDEFWKIAESFIELANNQDDKIDRSKVSGAMLYAVSRFNASVAAYSKGSAEGMKKDQEDVVTFFLDQYEKMFVENYEDYMENYEEYIQ